MTAPTPAMRTISSQRARVITARNPVGGSVVSTASAGVVALMRSILDRDEVRRFLDPYGQRHVAVEHAVKRREHEQREERRRDDAADDDGCQRPLHFGAR